MRDDELRKYLQESEEGPAFGFAQKTMRKIETLDSRKNKALMHGYNSMVAYLLPLTFLLLLLSSFFLVEPYQIDLPDFPDLDLSMLSFQVHTLWIAPSLLICLGLWLWLLWEKRVVLRK